MASGCWQERLSDDNEGRRRISRIVVHPGYVSGTYRNGIALLRLDGALSSSPSVQPISIPSTKPPALTDARVAGWGSLWCRGSGWPFNSNLTPRHPSNRQQVTVAVRSDQRCRSEPGTRHGATAMLCAGSSPWLEDACQGYSGGPLAARRGGKWYLSGITSWACRCVHLLSGVSTNVANYASWVGDRTGVEAGQQFRFRIESTRPGHVPVPRR